MKRPEFGFFKSYVQTCITSTTFAGSWPLAPMKAISLFPSKDSILLIKQGKVWATVNTGSQSRVDDYGDHFLNAGDSLMVRKGQHLVFEALKPNTPVFFDFSPIFEK